MRRMECRLAYQKREPLRRCRRYEQHYKYTQEALPLFREGSTNGTNYINIKAPNSIASNYTMTLPPDDGTNGYVLSTDGSGTTSWVNGATAAGPNIYTADDTIQSVNRTVYIQDDLFFKDVAGTFGIDINVLSAVNKPLVTIS